MAFPSLVPSVETQCRWLVRIASLLVPRHVRGEWRAEWEAELSSAMLVATPAQVRMWARGSLADAAWHRFNRDDLDTSVSELVRKPGFCIAALLAGFALIAALSGWFPRTRDILMPLPYNAPGRVAVVSERRASLSMRSGVAPALAARWSYQGQGIAAAATYRWQRSHLADGRSVIAARVSPAFFSVLGVPLRRPARPQTVLLSHDFWTRYCGADRAVVGHVLPVGATRYRIAGVLPRRFWFLSRDVQLWEVISEQDAEVEPGSTGMVVRLLPRAAPEAVAASFEKLAATPFYKPTVDVAPLEQRVRTPLDSFALGLIMALAVVLAPRLARWHSVPARTWRNRAFVAQAAFFGLKTLLAIGIVLLAGLEFTPATAITMTGGTDLLTEPLTTWLYLMGSLGALTWSIYDSRLRCRVCLSRLGLPAHVGCPGCLLLDWAGTEMVCTHGHGMLHVAEMPSSWTESATWTHLDESWQELFAR